MFATTERPRSRSGALQAQLSSFFYKLRCGCLPFVQYQEIPEHQVFNFFTVLKIILFTSWKSFVCIHKNYLSIYLHAIYTPPNFISMIICIESKKQSDYCQLNKPCSTSSWVSKKKNDKTYDFFFSSLGINEHDLY